MRHRPSRTSRLFARDTPLDTARRAYVDHIARCVRFRRGLGCRTCKNLDRRLTEAASGEVPWPACSTSAPTEESR